MVYIKNLLNLWFEGGFCFRLFGRGVVVLLLLGILSSLTYMFVIPSSVFYVSLLQLREHMKCDFILGFGINLITGEFKWEGQNCQALILRFQDVNFYDASHSNKTQGILNFIEI